VVLGLLGVLGKLHRVPGAIGVERAQHVVVRALGKSRRAKRSEE
jgi:hypothetical protein